MLLPLAVASGFVLALLVPTLRRILGRYSVAVLVALPTLLAAWLALAAPGVIDGLPVRFEADWVPQLGLTLAFSLDGLSLLFALLICGVGALVILYAERYLEGSSQLGRFHALLLAFMASMLGLVLADDLLLVYVFWGLTGITSFLLIGFDHEAGTSRLSAQQALIVTVAGELAMLAGFVLLGLAADTYRLSALPALSEGLAADGTYGLIVVLILAGALSKSGQFPFHFWLPNAMAAPTPVSAYLHSATMVTAGVYLAARLHGSLGGTELWTVLLVGSGGLTLLVGSALSLRKRDLKRLLAYSTIAALGMMIALIGVGTPDALAAAMALLLAHALYKGGLFLVTGIIDHETGTREIDRISGLARLLPITALASALLALSMAGVPPLVGFAAKELSLKASLEAPQLGLIVVALMLLAGAATVAVAGIAGVGPFIGRRQAPRDEVHEAGWPMWLGPIVLGTLGIAAGLAPWLGSGPLVAAAVRASSGEAAAEGVRPWYGVDEVLLLSGLSLVVGALIFLRRLDVRRLIGGLDIGSRIGPEKVYVSLERGMLSLARLSTGLLQNGRLRLYLLTVIATLVVLVWLAILLAASVPAVSLTMDALPWEVVIAVLIVGGAVVAVTSRSRLGAVAALSLVGYGISLVYLLFSAPDLAMAQILVETLAVLLFVLVFYHMPRYGADTSRASRLRDGLVALAGGGLLTLFVLIASARPDDPISTFFLESSQPLAKGRNVVNTILVDFRALDTLAEVTVLAIAGFGVYALLKLRAGKGGTSD